MYSMHVTCKQAATQESPVKSFQCGHCTLLFKSKVYLFEHLNKVHGFDVDVALREAGLKSSGTNNARTDNDSSSSEMGCELDVSSEQEKQCEKNVIENQITSENPETSICLTDQHKNNNQAAVAKEISAVLSVLPTSKTKCIISPSKDLKTYKRPLQVITKYFTVSPGSNGKPPINLADSPVLFGSTKETLILQESPADYSPHSSGVFKVTAKPTIDLSDRTPNHRFLLRDSFLVGDLSSQKPKEEFKRTSSESSNSPPAKKAKSDEEKTTGKRDKANAIKQPSNSTEFSFEFSEDEEEKKANLVNGDMVSRQVYFCKHCDYSDVRMRNISAHYQSNHPYVRYNAVYIRDASDQSATFRCLECPVEFLSVADLRRHYTENHPEAPDIFMMQSCEFRLVNKCFVCPFTTSGMKAMEGHYKQSHPSHKVDSPLMYCKYSATKYQEAPSPLITCEKTPSPGRLQDPKSSCTPCKEVTNEPSPKPPNSKGADVALYHCNKCEFSHKSVVVMHVHYQKNHPDEVVTIDKIKQSAHVKSHTTSQMVTVEEPTPQKNTSDSSEKDTRNKADTVSQEKMSFSLRNPKDQPETSKTHSESPKTKDMTFSEDRSKGMSLPTVYSGASTGMGNLFSSSPTMFYCKICSYSSTNVRSVVGHHNAKHTINAPTDFNKVTRYSAMVQKNKLQSEAKPSAKAKLSDSEPKQVEACSEKELQHEKNVAADASVTTTFNPYACAESLFYCQKCNYGNTTVFGVLSHQSKVHQSINSSRESIIEHTALIRDEIEKSKSQAKELDIPNHLPLPLMSEGDEDMFFCHFCNYRQNSVKQVLRHYLKRHRGFVVGGEQVRLYTSKVLKQTGNEKKKLDKVSASPSTGGSQTQRSLQCQRCTYTTQYVYLLKRHLQKIHKSSHSVTEVLRVCFKQGTLQTGYHCDLCVFSHKVAAAVYEHYQEQHPGRRPSLEYVTTRLYVGPKTCISKKKKPQRKHTDSISEGDDTDGSIPSQDETKTYSCRACSFKSTSMSVITRHYRAVHPWAVKEDGSVLDVISGKKQSVIRQMEDHSEIPVTFETYQVPLEFDNAQDSSHGATEKFKCHFCLATFPTQRSLNIHRGMKHQEAVTENLDEQQEEPEKVQTRLHVFKCPHCTYVNTSYQGVLTHCQMKHPALQSRAESLYVDEAHSHNCSKRNGRVLRLSGYMCETCPHIYATLEKLNKHCEWDHNDVVANAPLSAETKKNRYKSHSVQGSKVLKASFLSKKLRCQHCPYTCSTKLGIARHVHFHHNNSSFSQSRDSLFRCTLCSRSYFRKKRLGNHYINKHGKESFLKYYVPIYKQGHEKPAAKVPDHPSTQQPENPSEASQSNTTAEENKVLVYKCPNCPYVNASYHGTLTHCQMRHPDLIARADELQTAEILSTNMVSCKVGKASNERGYLCARCPQIHASLKKLKFHCERDHDRAQATASSENSVETEQPDQDSVFEADSTEIGLSQQSPGTPETCQTSTPLVKKKETLYKCHICNYIGMRRRYLHCHYKKTHKFDAIATCKLLQRYNKYKGNRAINLPKSEESADLPKSEESADLPKSEESTDVKCKMCPNLKFDSSQLLIDHYSTFHSSDCISDFIVLYQASKRTTGLYKCAHCMKQMNGIKKLCYHLDRHREKKMAEAAETKSSPVIATSPEAKTTELCREDEMPTLETVEELTQWNVTPVATLNVPPSPLPSPSKPTNLEEPEPKSREHTCKQCERTFMSLRGLRSHERSHAALAAIKKLNNLSTSALKHNVNKYLLYKAGTIRPFLCSVCSFRTTVMDLWKCHFMKKHQDVITDPAETENGDKESFQQTDKEARNSPEDLNNFPELDEEPEIAERSLYLEPPDVQRQLNHYNLMAQASAASKANVQASKLPESSLLHCEVCNFNTGHLSSMRRHYLNRHGKKILRCKDCDFFTGLRKTLELHIEAGHSTFQSEPTHQKDLCCPFCLYQTKNKNNMIDHIVLHREERVVPIEVCRPKLSRYLQGIVFRCHKCTFTSGTAENLRLHMMRHNDIKPYKCRLCYFDCTQLSDLEAHLSDKHQVLRNHELVGQVSLDQLEARVCRMPEEEEEPVSNLERHDNSEDAKIEIVSDCNEVPLELQVKNLEGNDIRKNTLQIEEVHQNQGPDGTNGNEESSLLLDLQCENTKPNTAVQEKHEQEPQEHTDTARGQGIENIAEQKIGEESNAAIQHEKFSCPEKEMQTNEKQDQPKFRDGEDDSKTFTQQKEEAAERTSTSYHERAEQTQAHKLQFKALTQRKLNIDTRVEDNIFRHILLLDEDGSRIHRKADQTRRDKIKQNTESEAVDNTEGISTSAKTNFRQANNIRAQECFKVDKLLLTHTPRCGPLKISHKEILGVTFTNCKEEQVQNQKNCEEARDPYGEMPVLENEYLKEEMQTHSCCKEEDQSDHPEQKEDKKDEMIAEEDEDQRTNQKHQEGDGITEAENPHVPDGAATDEATAEEKRFTCEFCGRNLTNSSELERHVIRHRI